MMKRYYFNDGQFYSEIPYSKGQIHGIAKAWYKNGQLMYEEPYCEDQRHGIARGWYKNGSPEYKRYYLYGDKVTQEEYRRHELIEKLSGLVI